MKRRSNVTNDELSHWIVAGGTSVRLLPLRSNHSIVDAIVESTSEDMKLFDNERYRTPVGTSDFGLGISTKAFHDRSRAPT